jgi:hypothetical protein
MTYFKSWQTFMATLQGRQQSDSGASLVSYKNSSGGWVTVRQALDDIYAKIASGGSGSGDVKGPNVSVDNHIVQFDGTTGKSVKDGGISISTDGTMADNSDTEIPTEKAVKTYAMPLSYLDTDSTMAANSDAKVPSQKAVATRFASVPPANSKIVCVAKEIGGGSSAITTGSKRYITIPVSGTLTKWRILADQSGSIVVDVRQSTYAGFPTTSTIAGSHKPSITSPAQKNEDSDLGSGTPFEVAVTAGDVWELYVESCSAITWAGLWFWIEVS